MCIYRVVDEQLLMHRSCMKDGQVVEQGQHDALMAEDGEYRKLYVIQATAYTGGANVAEGDDDQVQDERMCSAEDYE